jgi:hypothetical protein
MVDQKQIADIFNDFLSLYLGRSELGIQGLCEKYENHKMLLGLLSNLAEATKLSVPKVMKEAYGFYKKFRGRDLNDEEWQSVVDESISLAKSFESNRWSNRVIIELMALLETDEKERKKAADKVVKEAA